MAEVLREEYTRLLKILVISWNSWESLSSLLSSSPFTISNAGSLINRVDAVDNDGGIIGEVGWSAEVTIWNQISSVTPHAFSITSCGSSSNAISEVILSKRGSDDRSWVAELFGEEWSLSSWSVWLIVWDVDPRALGSVIARWLSSHVLTWVGNSSHRVGGIDHGGSTSSL